MLITRMASDNVYDKLVYIEEEEDISNNGYEEEEHKLSKDQSEYRIPMYITKKAEKKCGWCQRSNRHESLFPCGKFGISLMMFEFQFAKNSSLLALIALFWYEIVDIHNNGHWAVYILLVIGILVYLYGLIYLVPVCTRRHMLITNVNKLCICRLK